MRVFKNKAFQRFADRNNISNDDLCDVVHRASRGLIDADLGGGVIKQRIARRGKGKSGGFRLMILFRAQRRAVLVHGFAKKDRANIETGELEALRKLAKIVLAYSEEEMASAVASGVFVEVKCND
ncbi:MAG TPA: type II toxin-antitoxin system RelE/ParE family toxin [Terriglobales bacterium]|jgi:hypothetical protein|nr:type II toxin-antitoxin system RelE/ParE family toxin [Terriglobales bacterium]